MSDSFDRSFRPGPDVLTRTVGGELVLLDLVSEQYFSLDDVGAAMWEAIIAGPTLAAARDALVADFEVAPEELGADLLELVADLERRGLLVEGGP